MPLGAVTDRQSPHRPGKAAESTTRHTCSGSHGWWLHTWPGNAASRAARQLSCLPPAGEQMKLECHVQPRRLENKIVKERAGLWPSVGKLGLPCLSGPAFKMGIRALISWGGGEG